MIKWYEDFVDVEVWGQVEEEVAAVEFDEVDHTGPVKIGGVLWVMSKQWLLGGKFSEFEYSPKRPFSEICETRQTHQHSPSSVARTRKTRLDSPSHVVRTHQTRRHLPSRVARTRQTCERRVWWVLRKFSESGESGKFGECRLDHFMHIKYVICAKNNLSYHARLRQHSPRGLASTRQTCRHLPTCFAWTRQTRQHSPRGLASTRQTRRHSPTCFAWTRHTRPHSPKVISGKMRLAFDTFARVICHFCEFGIIGHCLVMSHKYLYV